MRCALCHKNEACVHLTQLVGEVTRQLDLCEPCARSKGIDDFSAFSLADIFLGLEPEIPSQTRPRAGLD